jgi:colicin import membrane protein
MSESPAPPGAVPGTGKTAPEYPPAVPGGPVPPRRPNLQGDLGSVLEFLPEFRPAVRGYERSQVDSYVAWAERELRAARRSADEMAARFASSSAQLERVQEELARSEIGRSARQVSDRMARLLDVAAEEAEQITAAAAAEGEQVVAEAREYAAAMLRHAREVEEAAVADEERAARSRAEADAALQAVRGEAAEIRAAAAAERDRLAADAEAERARLDRESAARRAEAEEKARRQREQEAAAAAEGVASARREVEELQRRRDQVAESLRLLTERIGEALQTLAEGLPLESPNIVAPQPQAQHRARGAVAGSVHAAS